MIEPEPSYIERVFRVTLVVRDTADSRTLTDALTVEPDQWDWHTLLDLGPDEMVTVEPIYPDDES